MKTDKIVSSHGKKANNHFPRCQTIPLMFSMYQIISPNTLFFFLPLSVKYSNLVKTEYWS